MTVGQISALAGFAVIALALSGCPRSGGGTTGPDGEDGPGQRNTKKTGKQNPAVVRGPITFAPCETTACMLHPGQQRYHLCLSAGAGRCFQYGGVCEPADKCMRDDAGVYRQCARTSAGQCAEFGSPCTPADRCMLEAATGILRRCEEVADGTCRRFGQPCRVVTEPASRETTTPSGT